MNIVHVLSSFGLGGQEKMALDLARTQRAAGHTVTAVSLAPPPDGPLAREFRAAAVATRTVDKKDGFDVSLFGRLFALFSDTEAHVVHTHNPQPLIFSSAPARLAGAVVVHTKHGRNPGSARRRALRRFGARFTDAFVAVSSATADAAARDRDCSPDKLRVIPNGIDTERFRPDGEARRAVRRELGISDDARVMGTVGRLAPEKNHELLLRAASPLLSESCHLIVAGDGPEKGRLEERLRTTDTPFVHLLGGRSDADRVLAAMDVFVMSSRTEGLPLVLPEAMATALPVVSTAVGGIVDVIEDEATGFLVGPDDEQSLRARLADLLSNRAAAAAMGQRAREVAVREYSANRMQQRYMDLYGSAIHRRTYPQAAPLQPSEP